MDGERSQAAPLREGSEPASTSFTFVPIDYMKPPKPAEQPGSILSQQINQRFDSLLEQRPAAQQAELQIQELQLLCQPPIQTKDGKLPDNTRQPPLPSATLTAPAAAAAADLDSMLRNLTPLTRPSDGHITVNVVKEGLKLQDTAARLTNPMENSQLQAAAAVAASASAGPGAAGAAAGAGLGPASIPSAGTEAVETVKKARTPAKARKPAPVSRRLPLKSSKANAGASSNGQFTSAYRGVTRHRLTGRFEAHFWDSTFQRDPKYDAQGRQIGRTKGRQLYIGGYDTEEGAARSYDKAAIAYLGDNASTNFPMSEYREFLDQLNGRDPEDIVGELRRGSLGFARGRSKFRGVTKHHYNGKWEARMGKLPGGKYLYLGVFDTAKDAAVAYDKALVKLKGRKGVTNFPLGQYNDILNNPDSYDVEAEAKKHGGGYSKPRDSLSAGGRKDDEEEYNFGPARPKRLAAARNTFRSGDGDGGGGRGRKNKRYEECDEFETDTEDEEVEVDEETIDDEYMSSEDQDGMQGRKQQEKGRKHSVEGSEEDEVEPMVHDDDDEDEQAAVAEDDNEGIINNGQQQKQQRRGGGRSSQQQRPRRSRPGSSNKIRKVEYIDSTHVVAEDPRNSSHPGYHYLVAASMQHQEQQHQQGHHNQHPPPPGMWPPPPPGYQQHYPTNAPPPYTHPAYGFPPHLSQPPPPAPHSATASGSLPPAPISGGGGGGGGPPAWWQTNTSMINPEIWMQWNALMQGHNISSIPGMPFPHPMHQNPNYQYQHQPSQQLQHPSLQPLQQQYGGGGGAPHHHPQDSISPPPRRFTKPAIGNLPQQTNSKSNPALALSPIRRPHPSRADGGLSPLAASLLSPLGLQANGKWKDSPLEKLFNAQDEAVVRLLNHMQNNDTSASRVGAANSAGAAQGANGQEDIWGALQWLDSLDMAQLTAGGARRGPPPTGNNNVDGDGGAGANGGVQQTQKPN